MSRTFASILLPLWALAAEDVASLLQQHQQQSRGSEDEFKDGTRETRLPGWSKFSNFIGKALAIGENSLEAMNPDADFSIRTLIHMDPRKLGSLERGDALTVCRTLARKVQIVWGQDSPRKKAMRTEGGIDGVIDLLRKFKHDREVADHCLQALTETVFYIEENQHYAGALGAQALLVDLLRTHIENADFVTAHVGDVGGLMDFCIECGDALNQAGGDELMISIMDKYMDHPVLIQHVLDGLTGNVYHSAASRDNLSKLGLIERGLQLIRRYPVEPAADFLKIRQEVIAVMSGLGQDAPRQAETRDAIVRAGYPAEALRLIREQPHDQPSLAKSVEMVRYISRWNHSYAELFQQMGAVDHVVWAMGNYTTPNPMYSGKFWNVDQSGSDTLELFATELPESIPEMIKAGAVQQLVEAYNNPEGAYQTPHHGARQAACRALRVLSRHGLPPADEAQVPEECK